MPIFIAALWGGLLQVAASLVGRVLLSVGVGYVTYRGLSALLSATLDQVKMAIGGLPGDVVSFLAWVWLDKAITMVFSAYLAALLVKGFANGAISKLKVK